MKKLLLALSPMVVTAGILALSGVAMAQYVVVSNCPQPRVTNQEITEDEARSLAQRHADKNLKDFNVVRPSGYGGGYNTVCYNKGKVFYSVEYSIDVKNKAGDMRILRVDQFGNVTEWVGTETATR